MKPGVSDFIPGSLEYTDKHIEVLDRRHIIEKPKGQALIKMCNNKVDSIIATLHNVLLAPEFCDRSFSIITLMNLVHNCLFHKAFYTVYFGAKDKNAVILPHGAQRKYAFWGEIKEMLKTNKLPSRKKVAL